MGHDGALGAELEKVLEVVEPPEPGFGASVSVFRDGDLVGAAWIGEAAPGRDWERSTPVVTWSASKGVAAILVAQLAQNSLIDPDAPIQSYWPEFGRGSCSTITLSDVMTHQAARPWLEQATGAPTFDDAESWTNTDRIEDALAAMEPVANLDGKVAYHALTFGWLVNSCVRRATGETLNSHLQRLQAPHHDMNMSFGTQSADIRSRLARPAVPQTGKSKADAVNQAFTEVDNPLRRALAVPAGMTFAEVLAVTQEPAFIEAETPAISLISDADSLAKAYSIFASAARGMNEDVEAKAGLDSALRLRAETDSDAITGGARKMALGFVLNSSPSISLAPGHRAFGHPGMGGSLAWGDPDVGLGFAYLTNASIPDTVTDDRAVKLSDLVWRRVSTS